MGTPVLKQRPTTSQDYPRKLEDVTPPCTWKYFFWSPKSSGKLSIKMKHRSTDLVFWGNAGWIIPILVLEAIVKKEHWDSWEHPGSFQTCGRSRQGHLAQESISQQEHMKGTSMALSRAETPYKNLGSLISGRPSEITEMGFPPSPGIDTIWRSVGKVHLLNPTRKVRPKGTFPVNFR